MDFNARVSYMTVFIAVSPVNVNIGSRLQRNSKNTILIILSTSTTLLSKLEEHTILWLVALRIENPSSLHHGIYSPLKKVHLIH